LGVSGDWLDKITLFGEPFGRDNAIEVANFMIVFGIPLDEADMKCFESRKEAIKEHFPSMEQSQGLHVHFGNESEKPPPPPPLAWKLSEYGRDGEPLWTVEFGNQGVVVSSRAYDKGDDVWPKAKDCLNALLDCVSPYMPVQSILYSVTDSFSAKKDDGALVCPNFFVENERLPAHLLEYRDPRWDISQGWFENGDDGEVTLVRFDAKGFLENDRTIFQFSNAHSRRLANEPPLKELLATHDGSFIEQTFDGYHTANKTFVMSVLKPDLLRRMGMGES